MYPYPYKSPAIALIFTILMGPLGLLYSSFWGGFLMLMIAFVVMSNKLLFLSIITWLLCSLWGVRAVESYNKKIYLKMRKE